MFRSIGISHPDGLDLLRRRKDGRWPDRPLAIASGAFILPNIDLNLPVSAPYRGIGMV